LNDPVGWRDSNFKYTWGTVSGEKRDKRDLKERKERREELD
jgi:hypothetical protein